MQAVFGEGREGGDRRIGGPLIMRHPAELREVKHAKVGRSPEEGAGDSAQEWQCLRCRSRGRGEDGRIKGAGRATIGPSMIHR